MIFKFICTKETRDEVFDKQLFADSRDYKKQVEQGDMLLLQDLDANEIIGPFEAETPMQKNIDQNAFEGRFPYQVKVDWDELYTISQDNLEEDLSGKQIIAPPDTQDIINQLTQSGQRLDDMGTTADLTEESYPDNWDMLRKQVYERDDYKCRNCGVKGGDNGNKVVLHAHHIVPVSSDGNHVNSNLVTLCQTCHNKVHPHMSST